MSPSPADSRAKVDAFHAAGLAAGGTDNGAPGLRPHYHPDYYGAFVPTRTATISKRFAIVPNNPMFTSILIANRGEIACRVIRTCRTLGIRTVAVYSEADADAQHVRQADEAYRIGGAAPAGQSTCAATRSSRSPGSSGAQAIHPGYGFLSENADFADAVEAAGIVFIGPNAASMRKMGSKAGAKDLMHAAGVPVVPGYTGEDQDADHLHARSRRDRLPADDQGRAWRRRQGHAHRARRRTSSSPSWRAASARPRNAFGRDRVLLERYVAAPRHIEIQVFGDPHGNAIHLNERECSAQRRYQKVLEESPSPFLTPELRKAMGEAAVHGRARDRLRQRRHGGVHRRPGPARLLFHGDQHAPAGRASGDRTGHRPGPGRMAAARRRRRAAAAGAGRRSSQRGHAIEVRLYAEDPEAGFLPGSGKLERLRLPQPSPHVRIDSGVVEGDTVTIFYDPMIAKLIVFDVDRPARAGAVARGAGRMRHRRAEIQHRVPRTPRAASGGGGGDHRHRLPRSPPRRIHAARRPRVDTDLLLAATVTQLLAQEADARARRGARPTRLRRGRSPTAGAWATAAAAASRSCIAANASTCMRRAATATTASSTPATPTPSRARAWPPALLSLRVADRGPPLLGTGRRPVLLVHDGEQRLRLEPVAMYRHEQAASQRRRRPGGRADAGPRGGGQGGRGRRGRRRAGVDGDRGDEDGAEPESAARRHRCRGARGAAISSKPMPCWSHWRMTRAVALRPAEPGPAASHAGPAAPALREHGDEPPSASSKSARATGCRTRRPWSPPPTRSR